MFKQHNQFVKFYFQEWKREREGFGFGCGFWSNPKWALLFDRNWLTMSFSFFKASRPKTPSELARTVKDSFNALDSITVAEVKALEKVFFFDPFDFLPLFYDFSYSLRSRAFWVCFFFLWKKTYQLYFFSCFTWFGILFRELVLVGYYSFGEKIQALLNLSKKQTKRVSNWLIVTLISCIRIKTNRKSLWVNLLFISK